MASEKREVINMDVHIRWKEPESHWEIQATHYGHSWDTQFSCLVTVNNEKRMKKAVEFLAETILIHIEKEERMMSIPDIEDPPYDLEAAMAEGSK